MIGASRARRAINAAAALIGDAFRPASGDRNHAPRWMLLAALTCIALPHLAVTQTLPAIVTNDSVWYLDQTHTWDSPRPTDYYAAGGKPVQYALAYPPGYPLFLDFCHLFVSTKSWARAVVGAQHLLSFLTAILVYGIGRKLGHPVAGCVAAALYGLYFPRLLYAQTLMSETLFAFLLTLSVHLSFASLAAGAVVSALAGLVFASAALTKFQAAAGIPLVLLLYWRTRAKPVKAWAFLASVIFAGALASLHNVSFYGHPGLTTFAGKHLANRVFASDGLVDPRDPDTRYILDRLSASGLPSVFPGNWWGFERALRTDGASSSEADRRVLGAALAGIRTDPWRYARNTAGNLFVNVFVNDDLDPSWFWTRENFAAYLNNWTKHTDEISPPLEYQARTRVLEAIETPPPSMRLGSAGLTWMRWFASPWLRWREMAAWFLVAGVLCALASGATASVFLAAQVITISLPGALFEFPVPRYSEPLMPLALLVSSTALPLQVSDRRIGRWLLLAALFLSVAAAGQLFEPSVRSFLWPAGSVAILISGAVLWTTARAASKGTPRSVAAGGPNRWSGVARAAAALTLLLLSVAVSLRTPPAGTSAAPAVASGARVFRSIPLEKFKDPQRLEPGAPIEGSLPGGAKFVGTVIHVGRDHVTVEMEYR